ncbi:MAG: hypothetical protein WA294_00375 [Acidobacteriaceae bacterium]
MRPNPAEEWQRLTKLYGEMSDGELEEVANDFANLTETAQPILRDEMKKRGLGDPASASQPAASARPVFGGWRAAPSEKSDEDDSPSDDSGDDTAEGRSTYTWKTDLCARDTYEEAWQVAEMLRRAGIESWPDRPGDTFGNETAPSEPIRILVAADQLDEARAVIAQPVPQDIIDQSREKPEDFVPPVCPKCGAADPTLESVVPSDSWICEECGAQWSGNPAFGPATSDAP